MYPHVTQFETIDNRTRELLDTTADTTRQTRTARRRRLLVRAPRVTSQPCR
jgi:hypothetical protein